MKNSIYTEIKKRIKLAESGTVFLTSDFTDLATTTTVRKYLGRQVEEKNIRRIMDGVYEKPVYSNLLNEYIPANPEKVAYAISWHNITLSFTHRPNREISFMSETTTLVVEALKTLGKDRIDDSIISSLKNRLPEGEKKKMLEEATGVSEWIYTVIRKVCAE